MTKLLIKTLDEKNIKDLEIRTYVGKCFKCIGKIIQDEHDGKCGNTKFTIM